MEKWEKFKHGSGRPKGSGGKVDVQYKDGKIFRDKPVENCYWGADTLIEYWRPAQQDPEHLNWDLTNNSLTPIRATDTLS